MTNKTFKWKYLIAGEWILAFVLAIPTYGIGFFIFAILAIYHQFLLKHEIEFTQDRIIHRKRFISETEYHDSFKNIVEYDIITRNNFWEAIFGAVNISLVTFIHRGIDTTNRKVSTYRIAKKDVSAFKKEIEELMARKTITIGSIKEEFRQSV